MSVSRRHFLTAALLGATVGCGRGRRAPAPDTLARIRTSLIARTELLATLPDNSRPREFLTPSPPVQLGTLAPELRGVLKLTHRLHPRLATLLKPDESHLNGPPLWPAEEPFPAAADGVLLVPVLQILSSDAPAQVTFKPDADVLQLFWDAREPNPSGSVHLVWREAARVGGAVAEHPFAGLGANPTDAAWERFGLIPELVPVPCRVAPERVLEAPSLDVLPARMRDKLLPLIPGGEAVYRDSLSVASGTKIGGYAPSQPNGLPPTCPICRWGMDYFVTLASAEWPNQPGTRWQPEPATPAERTSTGLHFDAHADCHLFVCRRCESWPAAITSS